MFQSTKLALSLSGILAAGYMGTAQDQTPKPPSDSRPVGVSQSQADLTSKPFLAVRASALKGRNIENKDGKKIGDIKEVLIDLPQARIAGVVVGMGGVLGIGEQDRILPPGTLMFVTGQDKIVIHMEEQLRAAKTKADHPRDYNELGQIYGHYQQETYWDKDTRQPVRDQEQKPKTGMFQLTKASELIGADVKGADGKELGEIDDLVLDFDSGRVVLAALATGGVLGVGEKLVAIPSRHLQWKSEGELALNTTEDRLKNAPRFDRAQWPDLKTPDWTRSIYTYYGETFYWTPQGEKRPGAPQPRTP